MSFCGSVSWSGLRLEILSGRSLVIPMSETGIIRGIAYKEGLELAVKQ